MKYNCQKCNAEVSQENETHVCKNVRSVHGQLVSAVVIYQPRLPKNKQQTQSEYMKRFGSHPLKNKYPRP